MKITIIHGVSHKGSTYHIARQVADHVGGDITEFFLPRDLNDFCLGCTTCFIKGEEKCPHYQKVAPITKALDQADLIILDSPVYVFHASGGMKNLLDHYGYRWMPHRPEGSMFTKQAVVVSTAAGMGMKSTNKDMADSLFYWGISNIYKLGIAVAATSWDGVSDKKRKSIDKKVNKIVASIKRKEGKVKPTIKGKFFFWIMKMYHKNDWNPKDQEYWREKGWLDQTKPWRK